MVGGTREGVGSVTREGEVVKTVKVVGKSSSVFISCVFSVLYTPSKSSELDGKKIEEWSKTGQGSGLRR